MNQASAADSSAGAIVSKPAEHDDASDPQLRFRQMCHDTVRSHIRLVAEPKSVTMVCEATRGPNINKGVRTDRSPHLRLLDVDMHLAVLARISVGQA